MAEMRIVLTDAVGIESGAKRIDERCLGGRQVRLLLAFLVLERRRPAHRDELADVLWPDAQPPTWRPALRALVSHVRALFALISGGPADVVTHAFGCYRLHLPAATSVDLEEAETAVWAAEQALRDGDPAEASRCSLEAAVVLSRPFLPGEEGLWVETRRAMMRGLHLRAQLVLATSGLRLGQTELAMAAAEEAVRMAPFSDSCYRLLMEAHAAAGNRAEALRDYERCRTFMAEELGVDPSPETQSLYLELLRGMKAPPVPAPGPLRPAGPARAGGVLDAVAGLQAPPQLARNR